METQSPLLPTPDHALVWREGLLYLLDQRLLPGRAEFLELNSASATARAIRDMVVRGAPAIGIAAAYGVVLAARDRYAQDGQGWRSLIEADLAELAASRPTAVNLFWALERMTRRLDGLGEGDPTPALLAEALAIHAEDIAANRRMGELGAEPDSEALPPSSPTATPGPWPPAATARPWGSSARALRMAKSPGSMPTRPAPGCRGPASPPGNWPRTASR